eukprot:TRINITY_DN8454_c0_g1_i4.p1 TRINITY_DN8454_c0_g1~~TRINITY_DN8454_c0_g1_i4.p1  ORF type:complete len:202 (+),score=13.32 TRINITY_DN8454_c0_g1_i4:170-775(+)
MAVPGRKLYAALAVLSCLASIARLVLACLGSQFTIVIADGINLLWLVLGQCALHHYSGCLIITASVWHFLWTLANIGLLLLLQGVLPLDKAQILSLGGSRPSYWDDVDTLIKPILILTIEAGVQILLGVLQSVIALRIYCYLHSEDSVIINGFEMYAHHSSHSDDATTAVGLRTQRRSWYIKDLKEDDVLDMTKIQTTANF